jgi:hypothetical protein
MSTRPKQHRNDTTAVDMDQCILTIREYKYQPRIFRPRLPVRCSMAADLDQVRAQLLLGLGRGLLQHAITLLSCNVRLPFARHVAAGRPRVLSIRAFHVRPFVGFRADLVVQLGV